MLTRLSKGQLLVEILVAIGLSSILVPVVYGAFITSRQGRVQEEDRLRATELLRDCQDAVKSVRELSWNSYPAANTYHPQLSGNYYTLVAGSETIDTKFTRSAQIADIQRDASGAIVQNGGTVDPSTISVTCTVSWNSNVPSSVSSTTYLTRYIGNSFWERTTQPHFDLGTFVSTESQSDDDGEVVLVETIGGSWSTPTLVATYDASGTSDALHVISDGTYAYLAKSGNPSLEVINVSTPASPSLAGSLIVTGNIADLYLSGNYLYLANTNNTRELSIADISNPTNPINTGNANLSNNIDAVSVYLSGIYAFVGRLAGSGSEFGIVNVSNPASPTVSSELEIGNSVYSLVVAGNYALLGTNNTTNEVRVVNVTNKSSPALVANYNLPGTAQVNSFHLSGTVLYVGTNNNTSGPEFYILNVSNPLSISTLGSYEVGNNVIDVNVSGTNAYITTASATKSFTVLNVSTPATISEIGFLALSGPLNGVYTVGDYAYIASSDNSAELRIIQGGAGGGGSYVTSGTYESVTLDAGISVAYNYLSFNTNEPSGTDVQLQVAVNDTGSGWVFTGPDGTSGTYYTGDGAVNLVNTKGRYFRAKAFLTGNGTATPQLQSFRINYSP